MRTYLAMMALFMSAVLALVLAIVFVIPTIGFGELQALGIAGVVLGLVLAVARLVMPPE